jgi:hypothetical protein
MTIQKQVWFVSHKPNAGNEHLQFAQEQLQATLNYSLN